ncbi:MAG: hypothetical protein WCC01_08665 [Acidimicrobiia bacterium]
MTTLLYQGLVDDARVALAAADRDGTAALNALVLGGMVAIGSSVTLVGAGGFAGVLLWALVWLAVVGAVCLWISPHLKVARDRRLARVVAHRAALEASRELAVEVLLAETASDDERRAAAALLVGDNSSAAESTN